MCEARLVMHEMVWPCWDGAGDLLQSLAGRKKRNVSTLFLCLSCFFSYCASQ